jgi:predicted NUDIX family phosphoesterase
MAAIQEQRSSSTFAPQEEHILVVKRKTIFRDEPAWTGLHKGDLARYASLIQANQEFLPRTAMEQDPAYKQIIPYLIFSHNNRYFLMQRRAEATEQRLKNKYSLGIGGHIRQEDITTGSLVDWARREFHEEVDYHGSLVIEPLGILNDDSNDVGKVHLGFVFLLRGDTSAIAVKSELKSGQLVTYEEGMQYREHMESWSQMVFDTLRPR